MDTLNSISSNSAELNLQSAVKNLSKTAGSHIDHMMGSLSRATADGVDTVSDSILKGLKDIKSELNISHIAQETPLGFVTGSFLVGALFEYATSRLHTTVIPMEQKSDSSEHQETILPYLPFLLAASQWGLSKLRERNSHRV